MPTTTTTPPATNNNKEVAVAAKKFSVYVQFCAGPLATFFCFRYGSLLKRLIEREIHATFLHKERVRMMGEGDTDTVSVCMLLGKLFGSHT